jgi:hypothetical protein
MISQFNCQIMSLFRYWNINFLYSIMFITYSLLHYISIILTGEISMYESKSEVILLPLVYSRGNYIKTMKVML